jgi:acyl transferase domain-containing protein
MVGADGKCYAWDARAQGYGRGEGIAALVLKSMDAALRDGDHIHAVIRETGLNQDGATKSITSPSVEAQIKLIEKCYSRAGLDMADTGYVEAHMTGTPVGDFAEARALARTFGKARKMGDPMYVGSVKTNVGHTESVSGLAGVIKAIYAMENRVIPQNLNYKTPNPKIPLQEWNLAVPTALTPWPEDKPLRTSINNFGYGGANSHVILEGAPKSTAPTASAPSQDVQSRLYLLSAKDQVAAQGMMGKLATYVKSLPDDSALGDIAYTLAERRTRYPWVAAVRASSRAELAERLGQKSLKASNAAKKPRLGFVLNGQGAQWYAMGRELIAAYPVFEAAVQRADGIFKDYGATWSLHEELMRDAKTTRVGQVHLSQPVTVALQLCLLDLLTSWNITPSALSSHSSGEIAAAYSVGALTFAEALGAAYYRGDIPSRSEELSKVSGGMLAAGITPEEATKYIANTAEGHAVVACINSPDSVTISGDMTAIDEVEARLTAEGIFARKLKVPLAYHSHHMQLLAKEYLEKLEATIHSKPDGQWTSKYRYASPVTGKIITTAKTLGPDYYVRNLTNPVQFAQAFETMCFDEDGKAQVDIIVEIGAHGTLSGPIRQMLKGREMPYLSTLSRNVDAVTTMQDLAADLVGRGCEVSLKAINSPQGKELAFVHNLPTYAWNHSTRYWYESRVNKELRNKRFAPHELIGTLLPGDNGLAPTWRNFLRLADISWLNDHQIQGYVVLPGAGYVAMAVEATRLLTGPEVNITGFQLKDIEVLNALTIPDSSAGTEVQLNMHPTENGWYKYQVSSLTLSNTWTINCSGFVRAETAGDSISTVSSAEFFHPGVKPTNVDPESLWADLRKMSMYHGEVFRPITGIKTARDKAITDITIKDVVSEAHDYVVHPTTLDGIFIAAYNGVPRKIRDAYTVIPRKFKGITISNNLHRKGGEEIVCHSTMHSVDTKGFDSTIAVTNGGESGDVTILVDHFFAQTLKVSDESDEKPGIISRLEWEADLTSTVPAAFVQSLKVKPEDDKQTDIDRKTTRVAFHFVHDAVVALGKAPDSISPKYAALWDWMKSIVDAAAKGELGPRSNTWARTSKGVKQMLTDEVNVRGIASAKLLVRVGQQLPKILVGEVDAAELNTDNLLEQYYVGNTKLDGPFKQLGQLVEQLALNRPGAQVLELSGSTGVGSQAVLEAFGASYGTDGTRTVLGHYDFTDTSEALFDAVKQKLAPWDDLLSCKQLNIEQDPKEQGFTPASYDLVVAPVLGSKTGSLQAALGNIHKLLKPGGQLVLIEPTQEQLEHKLVLGVLQESAASTSIQSWEKNLREAGFSGIQLQVGDSENARQQFFSVILAGKSTTKGSYPSSVSIVHTGNSDAKQWAQQLSQAIEAEIGAKPTVETLSELEVSAETAYIFIPELESPFVASLDRDAFETLKKFLVSAQNILWLSGGGLVDVEEPLIGATNGLLRVLRQEDAGKRCAHLDFAKGDAWAEDKIPYVVDVFKRTFNNDVQSEDQDWEYSVKDSIVFVPRVYPEIQAQVSPIKYRYPACANTDCNCRRLTNQLHWTLEARTLPI